MPVLLRRHKLLVRLFGQLFANVEFKITSAQTLKQDAATSVTSYLTVFGPRTDFAELGCESASSQLSCAHGQLLLRLRASVANSLVSRAPDAKGAQAKLAFELDYADGAIHDPLSSSAAGGLSRAAVGRGSSEHALGSERNKPTTPPQTAHPQALVGIFIIQGEGGQLGHLFARTLNDALWWPAPTRAAPEGRAAPVGRAPGSNSTHTSSDGASLHMLGRLHVLSSALTKEFDLATWHSWLGPGAPLLGGTHMCGETHHLAPWTSTNNQGNYMHKAWSMVRISEMMDYRYILSTDDDVLLPARTLRAFVAAAASTALFAANDGSKAQGKAHEHAKEAHPMAHPVRQTGKPGLAHEAHHRGCGVLLARLNSGIPTADAFADAHLPPAARQRLNQCYGHSRLTALGREHFIIHDVVRLGSAISPWDPSAWYAAVARNITGPGLKGAYKGVHPVRYNQTCTRLALELALQTLPRWWSGEPGPRGSARAKTTAGAPTAPVPTAPSPPPREIEPMVAPYFTNTLWLTSTELYRGSLEQPEFALDPFDEVPMNLFLLDTRQLPICILPEPALHPSYNTDPSKASFVDAARLHVEAVLGLKQTDRKSMKVNAGNRSIGLDGRGSKGVKSESHVNVAPLSGAF
eukprot:CAMPEP_0115862952 /NCGR_PEP_ID=MMETSP0287-20121206/18443_1 /TAXON_ID=412157 /ORGANISM="Chrysochromulina rotalis, Strain UIO044" /LENGTH=634 /DNA_ID=CAMNT_0003317393 /DNA_START=75 /DNA_END=1979 /DNA_ORIENTATION=+